MTTKIDFSLTLILLCVFGGIIGTWATLFLGIVKQKGRQLVTLLSFIVNSTFSIVSGIIVAIYSIAYVHKINLSENVEEKIFLSIAALLLNLISVKGMKK